MAFFFPLRIDMEINFLFKKESLALLRHACHAISTNADFKNFFPWVVRPLLFLPALSLLPGLIPHQLARCFELGKTLILGPISASIAIADCKPTPGIV